jgi:outer membrane protein OmpA-like peptidoglycan-associated protein
MKYIYTILLVALACTAGAQGEYKGEITFKQVQTKKIKDKITINFTIDTWGLRMGSQLMLTLTPIVRSNDNAHSYMFEPVIVTADAREKALRRAETLGYARLDAATARRTPHHNGRGEEIRVSLEMPYAPWTRDSKLILHELTSGCGQCEVTQREREVAAQTLPPLYEPEYRVSLIYPPIEPEKRRSDTHVSRMEFSVGNSELSRDFGNNAATLKRVDDFFAEIMSDPNLSVGTCSVQGFSSPEGSYDSNMALSEGRVYAFVNFLRNKYDIPPAKFQTSWHGEDWDGLLRLLSPLSFKDKEEVVRVIRAEPDAARRKEQLKAISGGKAYLYLLREVFPLLRRSEYTINYIARPFNVAEAKAVINQKPCHLSLNEMYLVAHTYEKGSAAFNEVFQIAVEAFPEAPIARINAGAVDVNEKRYDSAIGHLLFLDQPEAWNNLGIAYARVKNYESAIKFFERAAKAGNQEAPHNLQELQKLLDDYLY